MKLHCSGPPSSRWSLCYEMCRAKREEGRPSLWTMGPVGNETSDRGIRIPRW